MPRILPVLASLVVTLPAFAHECSDVREQAARLACFDRAFPSPSVPTPPTAHEPARTHMPSGAERTLVSAWDLDSASARPAFELRAHRPVYVLAATHTDRVNDHPSSPSAGHAFAASVPLDATEAQFQFSMKTKLWDGLLGGRAALWAGYTQSSRWQVYNDAISRPFRETNYEPEAMFVVKAPLALGEWNSRFVSVGVNHQSNGRALPLSRSWNRVIAQWGVERDGTMILVRPWYRLPETASKDDNPDIGNFIGRGEVVVAQRLGQHVLALQLRHSLRGGENNRGSAKLDWSIPISGYLKAHLTAFSGYGESLIDYNHRQTMFGAGISLIEWF